MITDGEKWHYLAVKKLSASFRGVAFKNNGDFYCINCLNLYRTESIIMYVKIIIIVM